MAEKTETATRVLDVLHRYRDAESAMNERARAASGMSENEMRIVRFLLTQAREHHAVTPTDLSRHLGVTSASMTALLDRLERAGAIERVRHPSDRRSLLITATEYAEQTVGAPLLAFQDETQQIADDLDPAEYAAVVSFLERLTLAADRSSRIPAYGQR